METPLEEFTTVAECVAMLARSGAIEEPDLLGLYGLYKQTTVGPCTGSRPGIFNLAARKKYDAWKSVGDLPSADAAQKYISKFLELRKTIDLSATKSAAAKSATQGFGVSVSTPQKNQEDEPTGKSIWDLVKSGRCSELAKLNAKKTNWNVTDEFGLTPLHWAADRGHGDVVRLLLSRGANLNARDVEGQTPLHYAASCGHAVVAGVLLKAGADSSAVDVDGQTPADGATGTDVANVLAQGR